MSRSYNSRKGTKHHRQGKRHTACTERSCPYCRHNFNHSTKKQQAKHSLDDSDSQ